ncbi:MAG TPA: hypothetical protein VEX37_16180, partial [Thermomicrobiales bacterium]|nr:hypothetical protein [Thermomicrobiales bacterium]
STELDGLGESGALEDVDLDWEHVVYRDASEGVVELLLKFGFAGGVLTVPHSIRNTSTDDVR